MESVFLKNKLEILSERVEEKKSTFFLVYTLSFLSVIFLMFASFFLKGRSFIWQGDGFSQHYPALMYLRKFYEGLFSGEGLYTYDFSMGFGGNRFAILTYYGFFDPINQLSALISVKYTEYLYSFLMILRLYLSGLSFIFMSCYFGKKRLPSILGAMIYLSYSYTIFIGIKHPFFLNPMIYLPILVVGIDKILRKQKPFLFIFGISFSALSGFYFLYMMTIILFLFANVRFFELYKETGKKWKEYFLVLLKTGFFYLLAIGLASMVFLPNLLLFLGSNRVGITEDFYSIMDFEYLKKMLSLFYLKGDERHLSVPSFLFFTIILTAIKYHRRNRGRLLLLGASIVGLGIPMVGKVMNGFSYPSNRWMFATSLILAYFFVDTMKEFYERRYSKWIGLVLLVGNLVFILLFAKNFTSFSLFGILFIDLAYFLLYLVPELLNKIGRKTSLKLSYALSMFFLLFYVGVLGYATNNIAGNMALYEPYGLSKAYSKGQERRFVKANKKLGDETFFRVDGSNFKLNFSSVTSLPNESLYWSIINPYLDEFYNNLGIAGHTSKISFNGLDSRVGLSALFSNRYFVAKEDREGEVPFGYKKIDEGEKNHIFENHNFLPFGYTYDAYLSYEEAEPLFYLDKEINMLDYVFLEEAPSSIKKGEAKSYIKEVKSEVRTMEALPFEDFDGFKLSEEETKEYFEKNYKNVEEEAIETEEEGEVGETFEEDEEEFDKEFSDYHKLHPFTKFFFEVPKGEEAFLYLEDLLLKNKYSLANIYFYSDRVKNKDVVRSKKSVAYFHRNHFLFHIGNANKEKNWCGIKINNPSDFPIKDMKILSLPVKGIDEKIEKLRENTLCNLKFEKDRVSGTISLSVPKVLTMSIPYEKGWKAYVDGVETKILRGNYMFSCLPLDAGEHEIEMRYQAPGMGLSKAISAFSLLFLLGLIVYERRRKNADFSSSSLL